jgi:hypothetical protein
MILAVSFEIIIQQAVGNEWCDLMKNTLKITVLSNRSRKTYFCTYLNRFHGLSAQTVLYFFHFSFIIFNF